MKRTHKGLIPGVSACLFGLAGLVLPGSRTVFLLTMAQPNAALPAAADSSCS